MGTFRIPLGPLIDGVREALRTQGALPEVQAHYDFPEAPIIPPDGHKVAPIPARMASLLCQLAIAERLEAPSAGSGQALVGAINDLDARLVITNRDR